MHQVYRGFLVLMIPILAEQNKPIHPHSGKEQQPACGLKTRCGNVVSLLVIGAHKQRLETLHIHDFQYSNEFFSQNFYLLLATLFQIRKYVVKMT